MTAALEIKHAERDEMIATVCTKCKVAADAAADMRAKVSKTAKKGCKMVYGPVCAGNVPLSPSYSPHTPTYIPSPQHAEHSLFTVVAEARCVWRPEAAASRGQIWIKCLLYMLPLARVEPASASVRAMKPAAGFTNHIF